MAPLVESAEMYKELPGDLAESVRITLFQATGRID
jgi:hypothetical protein